MVADLSITISNSMRVFGPSPATKWGNNNPYTMTWGSSKWGEGTADLIVAVEKLVSQSLSLTPAYSFETQRIITNAMTVRWAPASISVSDGSGYSYVNPSTQSYTSQAAGSSTWTSMSAQSTNWSEQ